MLEEGDPVPDFEVENHDGETVESSVIDDAVIYFYPKASTPGCTEEACSFRDSLERLEDSGMDVYGVSVDTVEDQREFHEEHELGFDLLADIDGEVTGKFGVLHGSVAERTTFLVRDGKVEKVFRDVDPEKHVDELLQHLD